MKINQKRLLSIVCSEQYNEFLIKKSEEFKDVHTRNLHLSFSGFMRNKNFRKLILSKKTKENLGNYKVPNEIRFSVLKSLPNRLDCVLISEKMVMRYEKTDTFIRLVYDENIGNNLIQNSLCFIDLINHDIKFTSSSNNNFNMNLEFNERFYSLFMVVVTYLELTPVTFNIIQSNRGFGTVKSGKIKNELKSDVIYVTTNWNVETINLSVSVRGHWRLQPYGIGRSSYKYVFISPYEKGLVRRLPQKELV